MSKEFFNYIATRIISYFEQECDNLHAGDRFCFKLDNSDLVEAVYGALNAITREKEIQGVFEYQNTYQTFTIKLKSTEVIVAAQINGMTDDFFATLRNIPLSANQNPFLMITCAPIDTISSATRDLSEKGMPFHADELIQAINDSINESSLSSVDHVLLMHELKRKREDRFADHGSLFEYKSLLAAVCSGKVTTENWIDFRLLPDADQLALISDSKKQEQRINDNHRDFEEIDRIFRFGNLRDGLENDYDNGFISELEGKKRRGEEWFVDLTYIRVLQSKAKKEHKQSNPLVINDEDIIAYHESPIEYQFVQDEMLFIRNGGDSKAKQREKHLLIYNPDKHDYVNIMVSCNHTVRQDMVIVKDKSNTSHTISGKEVSLHVMTNGCTFSNVEINDPEYE